VNPYDYAGGIKRANFPVRLIITGVLAPGVGLVLARLEYKPLLRAVMRGGVVDAAALRPDYVDELAKVGRRRGYPTVARAVYRGVPSLITARSHYPEVKAPIHLVYGEQDWSRSSDRQANRQLLPAAQFTQVPSAGHFIALERPDVVADLLKSTA
jgi:pimeloyl-ACP methyl ester carboxylesterase